MKIQNLKINNFMLFEETSIDWSKNINVIFGENSTGKTTLLKLMYSVLKPLGKNDLTQMPKELTEKMFVEKLLGVFRPDEMRIGRMVSRRTESKRADFSLDLEKKNQVSVGFGFRHENHADISLKIASPITKYEAVYIPTREMISATEHFASLYDEYHLDFEEMYYDLAKLLDKPLKKGANTAEQNAVLNRFEEIMKGQVVQKNRKFYLKIKGQGEFEMGLVSEGYRKLSMLIYLILSGSLNKNSVLFWDEPETNMNPRMIRPIVQAIIELAKMGVQIFVTTHDYFVQQEFNLLNSYPEINDGNLDIRFLSLYSENGKLVYELKKDLNDFKRNAIMEEFDALYDREQRLIYGD